MKKSEKAICFIISFLSAFYPKAQDSSVICHAYINYAELPGILGFNARLFRFNNDTLAVMNLVNPNAYYSKGYNDCYDTTYYLMTVPEKNHVLLTIESLDTIESVFNVCIIDGLRFYFSCGIGTANHHAWVSNAYDQKIFSFIDIINNHVPPIQQIRYNKNELITEQTNCLSDIKNNFKN